MALHHHAGGQTAGTTATDTATILAGGAIAILGVQRRDWLGAALAAVGGGLAFSGLRAKAQHFRHSKQAVIPAGEGIRVDETIVVDRPVALVFRFWRRLENLPIFMRHLVSVRQTGENTSHWVAKGPVGSRIEWDAEIINEVENELIAWKSLPTADVESAGSVHFTPGNNGAVTVVRVELKYNPPAGRLGAALARLFREEPGQQVAEDLREFKCIIEEPDFTTAELEVLARHSKPVTAAPPPSRETIRKANEIVDETSDESFPASDVPSWGPRKGI